MSETTIRSMLAPGVAPPPSLPVPTAPPAPRAHRYYPRPLIFLHIPKAAGTTLQEIIVAQYKGGKGFRFTGDPAKTREFLSMPEAERASYDVLTGHVHFGIHRHVPGPVSYVTMLRDPVERVVSHYYFVLRKPDHYLHPLVAGRTLSLREYVEQRTSVELDNDQVRYFTETTHQDLPWGGVTADHLAEAKRNLEAHFPVIGLAERFDESLVTMQCMYGWLNISYERRNVTERRPRLDEIDPGAIAVIRETNRLDIALYEFGVRLFERQIGALGDHFEARWRVFRQVQARRAARPAAAGVTAIRPG